MKGRQEVRLPKISSRREITPKWKVVAGMFDYEGVVLVLSVVGAAWGQTGDPQIPKKIHRQLAYQN